MWVGRGFCSFKELQSKTRACVCVRRRATKRGGVCGQWLAFASLLEVSALVWRERDNKRPPFPCGAHTVIVSSQLFSFFIYFSLTVYISIYLYLFFFFTKSTPPFFIFVCAEDSSCLLCLPLKVCFDCNRARSETRRRTWEQRAEKVLPLPLQIILSLLPISSSLLYKGTPSTFSLFCIHVFSFLLFSLKSNTHKIWEEHNKNKRCERLEAYATTRTLVLADLSLWYAIDYSYYCFFCL